MDFNKLIRVEEIVEVIERNVLYSWKLRILGSVGFIGVLEDSDGAKHWYKEGKRHRLDGPAIEYSNGYKAWFKEGLLHRLDGPAVERSNGTKKWYIEGKEYTEEEFNALKNCPPNVTIGGVEYRLEKV